MRTILIVLSIGLFFTLIHYSNGAPIEPTSSESEEDDNVETINLKPISDSNNQNDESDETVAQSKPIAVEGYENDQSSAERKKVMEVVEPTLKLEAPYSHSDEEANDHDDKDDSSNIESVVNNNHGRIFQDSDEE